MYRFRPKKYTSVLTIIILISIIYYLWVMLSTFREFPGHIIELPVQVLHSGTTVQRIAGLKKNVCHSLLSQIHLSFSKDRMLLRTQKPCQTGLTCPFWKFKGKVLVTSDSVLLSSEVLLFTQGWWTAQPALSPAPLLSLPFSGYEIPCTLFLPPQGTAVVKTTSNQMESLAQLRKAWGQEAKAKGPSVYVTLANCFWLQPSVHQIHKNDHGWGRENGWGALGANWDSIFI